MNVHTLDDQLLDITIDDILNRQQYRVLYNTLQESLPSGLARNSIIGTISEYTLPALYEPIYGRWDKSTQIQYRWTPIFNSSSSQDLRPDYILVHIYYPINIDTESIIKCFNHQERFGGFITSISNEITIKCPTNIPLKEICMRCYQRKCGKFRYGLKPDSVHIGLSHLYCTQCMGPVDIMRNLVFFIKQHYSDRTNINAINTLITWLQEEEYDDDAILYDLDCYIEPKGYDPQQSKIYQILAQYNQQQIFQSLHDYFIDYHGEDRAKMYTNKMHNADVHQDTKKISFHFQILLHEAVMKHTNPSLKIRPEELKLIDEEILSLHQTRFGNTKLDKLPDSFRLNKCGCDILRQWDHNDIYQWILKIKNGLLMKYSKQLKDALKEEKLNLTELRHVGYKRITEWGINDFDDRKILYDAIKLMVKRVRECPCSSLKEERQALITCYCNQLKREHKERALQIFWMNKSATNIQIRYFNFNDDKQIMNEIAKNINNDIVSPYEWMEDQHLQELKTSHFDPKDIMKKLMMEKHKNLKEKYPRKLKLEELILDDNGEYNGKYGKWGKAIQKVIKYDCDSRFRQTRCKSNADDTEEVICCLLNENGYKNKYITEIDLQKDPDYDDRKGTPDIVFIDDPLVININGKKMNIHWIDVKNFCFWITTKMRYKFWQQQDKYNKVYGMGMFVLAMGYVENINVGDNVVIVSLKWLKKNIPNIGIIGCDEEKVSEIVENDEWVYYDEEEDERCVDYTKLLPAGYREDYGAMYPTKERVYRVRKK